MLLRILAEITLAEAKQCGGWLEPVFLQMNERARELDQPLVESIVCALLAFRQPKLFQDIVGFVEELAVKTLEVPQVMRGQILPVTLLNQRRDLRTLLAHSVRETLGA